VYLTAQGDGLSRKERMMRQLGLRPVTDEELAEEVQQLQDDFDDDD
jgi:phage terminase small subunit